MRRFGGSTRDDNPRTALGADAGPQVACYNPFAHMADLLYSNALPERFANVADVDEFITRPSAPLVADLAALDGDIAVLGVGGKMGPSLARLARRAAPAKRIVAVARFTEAGLREQLAAARPR